MASSSTADVESATVAGRAEAEALDARLRAVEAEERDARIRGMENSAARRPTDYESVVDVDRLTARLEELTAFRQAVHGSFVWRAAQALRRILGRAW